MIPLITAYIIMMMVHFRVLPVIDGKHGISYAGASVYFFFSLIWPVTLLLMVLYGVFIGIYKFCDLVDDKTREWYNNAKRN